ncbi:ERF family protein [Segatella copri]|uniref:Single-stranded DNA-binding protein n=1 Tax=Segatella copri TaxID=165179 RepID=A0A414Y5P3_9BACT|nr:ERF family protein [Segatella copri]RHH81410.1 single-stranded DNA-binding protein [Segatella copri]
MKELIAIQSELKAPKSQFNKFGGYKYRKAEDILESVKPLLAKQKCTLIITDDVVLIGNRIYVKATATIKNEKGECETTNGWAREEETKKGMDGSQITGASSSYARKNALNGLFAIDDNADSDTTNDGQHQEAQQQTQTQQPAAQQPASSQYHPSDLNEGLGYLSRCVSKDNLLWVIQHYQPLCSNTQFMQAVSAKKKQLGIQ